MCRRPRLLRVRPAPRRGDAPSHSGKARCGRQGRGKLVVTLAGSRHSPSPPRRSRRNESSIAMTRRLLAILFSIGALCPALADAGQALDLSGPWRFELDRQDAGIAGRWFADALPGTIQLPGSLPAQGVGDPIAVDTK